MSCYVAANSSYQLKGKHRDNLDVQRPSGYWFMFAVAASF